MRRRTLLLGGVSLAAGVVVCGGLALQPTVRRQPRRELRALTPITFSVLAAAADRICPALDGLPSAWDLEVPEAVDTFLDTTHPGTVAEVNQLLQLLESGLVGLALDGRPTAFSACDGPVQDQVLEAWRDSRVGPRRTGYKALVALVAGAYWGNAVTWKHLGYPGPPQFPPPGAPAPVEPAAPASQDPEQPAEKPRRPSPRPRKAPPAASPAPSPAPVEAAPSGPASPESSASGSAPAPPPSPAPAPPAPAPPPPPQAPGAAPAPAPTPPPSP